MKYNINVIKSVWRRLRKPSRARLNAICSQNAVYNQANRTTDAQTPSNPIPMTFGSREASEGLSFLTPPGGPGVPPGVNYEDTAKTEN
jgi:hypothetical protein